MPNCINYDCSDAISDHLLNECGRVVLGGGSGILFLECNNQLTDPSDATEIAAEIAAGRATLFTNVKIGIGAPSPITVDSLTACGTPTLVNYDRSLSMIDGNVNSVNGDTYNTIYSGRKFGGAIVYICGTEGSEDGEKVLYIDAQLTFTGGLILPETNTEATRFEGTGAWRALNSATIHTAPAGIF